MKILEDKTIVYEGIEKWQLVLANFYADESNKLLAQRDSILKKLYALASKHYKLSGEIYSLALRYPHLRKPWFKKKVEG